MFWEHIENKWEIKIIVKIKTVFYLIEVHGNLYNYFELEIFSVQNCFYYNTNVFKVYYI